MAQITASTSRDVPSVVMIDALVKWDIGVRMKETLSSVNASRYPIPGVGRRHSGAKSGRICSRISGFFSSRLVISAVYSTFALAFSSVSLNQREKLRQKPLSTLLRKV